MVHFEGNSELLFCLGEIFGFLFSLARQPFFAVTAFEKCLKKAHTCVCGGEGGTGYSFSSSSFTIACVSHIASVLTI